ncbi:MAG: ribosome maturation factor RimP [Oscillospiraceae bacterium]
MAKGKKATEVVEEIVKPVCDEMGLVLWDVRFEKEGPEWYLRVFIDKDEGGIFIDDCEKLSRTVDPLIDSANPIEQGYFFEVSSAGLGRKLTKPFHFEKKMGEVVLARLIHATDGVKEIKGKLSDLKDGVITIEKDDGTQIKVALKDTSFVKLCDDEDLF